MVVLVCALLFLARRGQAYRPLARDAEVLKPWRLILVVTDFVVDPRHVLGWLVRVGIDAATLVVRNGQIHTGIRFYVQVHPAKVFT